MVDRLVGALKPRFLPGFQEKKSNKINNYYYLNIAQHHHVIVIHRKENSPVLSAPSPSFVLPSL